MSQAASILRKRAHQLLGLGLILLSTASQPKDLPCDQSLSKRPEIFVQGVSGHFEFSNEAGAVALHEWSQTFANLAQELRSVTSLRLNWLPKFRNTELPIPGRENAKILDLALKGDAPFTISKSDPFQFLREYSDYEKTNCGPDWKKQVGVAAGILIVPGGSLLYIGAKCFPDSAIAKKFNSLIGLGPEATAKKADQYFEEHREEMAQFLEAWARRFHEASKLSN